MLTLSRCGVQAQKLVQRSEIPEYPKRDDASRIEVEKRCAEPVHVHTAGSKAAKGSYVTAAKAHFRESPCTIAYTLQDLAPIVCERASHRSDVIQECSAALQLGAKRTTKREGFRKKLSACVELTIVPDALVERRDQGRCRWDHGRRYSRNNARPAAPARTPAGEAIPRPRRTHAQNTLAGQIPRFSLMGDNGSGEGGGRGAGAL